MYSFTLQRQPQTSNIFNNSLWPSSYYDSCFWVHHKILVMSSFDGLQHPFHPSHHTSYLGPINYSKYVKWMSNTFQNMGGVMDRGIFIQLVKTLTMHHLHFGLLEVIVVCVHCALASVGYQWRLGAHWEEVVWKHYKTLRYGPLDFACLIWSWSQVCQRASVQSLMGGKCSMNYGVHKTWKWFRVWWCTKCCECFFIVSENHHISTHIL